MITEGFEQLDPTLGALNLSSIVVTVAKKFWISKNIDFFRFLFSSFTIVFERKKLQICLDNESIWFGSVFNWLDPSLGTCGHSWTVLKLTKNAPNLQNRWFSNFGFQQIYDDFKRKMLEIS